MDAADPLSGVYKKALESYEELYRQRKLKPEQLALIKGQASISEVLQDISRTKVKYESERSAVSKLVHKITPAYIDKLDRASKIVETAIQSNPEIAALVWSGIKFIVLISQDIFHTYDRICDIMEKISLCLELFSEIAGLYQMTKLLDSRFVTLYCDIIEFCLKTIEFYARSKWRKFAASFISIGALHGPFDELLKKICDHAEEIEKAADVEHQKRTKNIELKVQSQAMGTVAVNPSQKVVFIPNILHPLFTGRAKQLETISQSLNLAPPGSKKIAVYGMPGAGKTQLALRFATENTSIYQYIFHVQATAREQLTRDYQSLYGLLGLRAVSSPDSGLEVERVKNWLVNHHDWLIIFDNVIETSVVRDFIPAVSSGSMIFTMRDRNIARHLGLAGIIELLPMDEGDGVDLILNISGQCAQSVDPKLRNLATEINRELGGLPLALEQGASFATDRDWSLERYLGQLRKQKLETLKLGGTSNSNFYSSFMLAIDGITPEAMILLGIVSYLDHQNVPLNLFSEASKTEGISNFLQGLDKTISLAPKTNGLFSKLKDISSNPETGNEFSTRLKKLIMDENELEDAITCLQASALIRRKDVGSIWMHDLARDISESLIVPDEQMHFISIAIALSKNAFEPHVDGNYEAWVICEPFTSHVATALRHAEVKGIPFSETRSAMEVSTKHYSKRHRYNEALHWYENTLVGEEKSLGKDHPSTLTTVHSMASVFENQGEYDKALEWYGRALAGRGKSLGKDHPDTLTAVHNMASVFDNQGEYDKGLEWYGRALSGREKRLGKDHPSTLTTVHKMASVFDKQGEYDKALEWYGRALSGREKRLGKDHPNTLLSSRRVEHLRNKASVPSK